MKLPLLAFLLLINTTLLAQTVNYVVRAPNSITPGNNNTLIGQQVGNTTMTGWVNTMIGAYAGGDNTTGNSNVFLGAYSGESNTTGSANTFLGYYTGKNTTTGIENVFGGRSAGFNNIDGDGNVFIGTSAGFQSNSTNNTYIGTRSGYNTTTGINNVVVGPFSGSVIQTGSNNVMLGFGTQPSNGTIQNSVAIGANARVARNNAIVLGDPTNTSIVVGIGTNAPQFPLDVRGIINLRNSGTIKFSHLLNPNIRNGLTDQFLTVNEEGETVLARHRIRIDNVAQWSDKVFDPTYHLPSLNEVERYVQLHRHLPNVPSAEDVVKEGVDLVKMNATLLEKVEELTLYSIEQEKHVKEQQQINQQQAKELELLKQKQARLEQLVEAVLKQK
ncbi:hypothetical protein GCM10028807_09960 [Spirosoma daeguense]